MSDAQSILEKIYKKLDAWGQRPTWGYLLLVSTSFAIIGAETAWLIHVLASAK